MKFVTPSQCRAARGLLNWTQTELAERSDMHKQTISQFEAEKSTPSQSSLEKIAAALENAGVIFTEYDGVNPSTLKTKTYHKRSGFIEFMNFVFETARDQGGEFCVSNVDETIFTQHLGQEADDAYDKKMASIKDNFSFKILIKEGDKNFIASKYAEYRWISKDEFYNVPFYVFGDNLAFIIYGNETTIHLINNAEIANTQRNQFNLAWNNAKIIDCL